MNVEGINRIPEKYYTQKFLPYGILLGPAFESDVFTQIIAAGGAGLVIFYFIPFNAGASDGGPRGWPRPYCVNNTGYF